MRLLFFNPRQGREKKGVDLVFYLYNPFTSERGEKEKGGERGRGRKAE